MTRNKLVAGALALVVGAGAIGWVVGSQITSPAEAAAKADPPTPSLITVAVDERLLSADIVARGAIGYNDPISLEVSGPVGEAGSPQIVTMVPEVGTELLEGSVALEIVGRPVILLQGELPVYRDLRPGSSGDDVLQLEEALVRLGFLASADSRWDSATGAAIQALYASVGYVANSTSKSDQEALKGARDQVRFANQALQDAQRALNEAGGATGSALLEAQNAVAYAEGALAVAQATRTSSVAQAQGLVALAQTESNTAAARLATAQGGTHPDTGDPLLPGELAVFELEAQAAAVALTDANNALSETQTAQNLAVASAERDVTVAKARLVEAKSPGDVTSLRRAVDDARRSLSDATQGLVEIESSVGTWLPAGELIYVKRLPVQVNDIRVTRGSTVSGAFATVSGSDIAMTIGISESDSRRVSVGQRVLLNDTDFVDTPVELEVAEISQPSSSGRVTLTVLVDDLPIELLGMNVRVTIPIESTSGEVLVVPAAALSAVADGSTRVEVEDPNKPGTTRFVTVSTGLATGGVVEVRPVDGELKKGDRVVVGQADVGTGGSTEPDPSAPAPAQTPESSE